MLLSEEYLAAFFFILFGQEDWNLGASKPNILQPAHLIFRNKFLLPFKAGGVVEIFGPFFALCFLKQRR